MGEYVGMTEAEKKRLKQDMDRAAELAEGFNETYEEGYTGVKGYGKPDPVSPDAKAPIKHLNKPFSEEKQKKKKAKGAGGRTGALLKDVDA